MGKDESKSTPQWWVIGVLLLQVVTLVLCVVSVVLPDWIYLECNNDQLSTPIRINGGLWKLCSNYHWVDNITFQEACCVNYGDPATECQSDNHTIVMPGKSWFLGF